MRYVGHAGDTGNSEELESNHARCGNASALKELDDSVGMIDLVCPSPPESMGNTAANSS